MLIVERPTVVYACARGSGVGSFVEIDDHIYVEVLGMRPTSERAQGSLITPTATYIICGIHCLFLRGKLWSGV